MSVLQTNKQTIYLSELLRRLVGTLEASVHDVDAVVGRIGYVLLHEAAEARQVGRDARYAHDRALSCTKHTQSTTTTNMKNTTKQFVKQRLFYLV